MAVYKNPLRAGQACGLRIATWVTSSSGEAIALASAEASAGRMHAGGCEALALATVSAQGGRMRRAGGALVGRAVVDARTHRARRGRAEVEGIATVWASVTTLQPLQPERPSRFRRHNLEDFQQLLLNLLPRGRAWPRDGEDAALMMAWAEELYRVENRGWKLLEEWDPRTTDELFEEWEAFFELPGTGTEEQRRIALIAEWLAGGTLSRKDTEQLLKELGIDATVVYWRPFRAGVSAVGDSLATDWFSTWTVYVHNPDQVDLVWLQDYLRRIAPAGDYVHVVAAP
jgi:uncharacterized protein YmfQ (DUF2313 family)